MAGIIRHLRKVTPPLSLMRLLSGTLSQNRSFSAAALQYQYDDEEELSDEMYLDQALQTPFSGSEGSFSRKIQWVFIGNPSSKKHLYAEKLSKLLEVPHISMGSLVRQELHPHSYLYKKIANSMNQGKLVPEEIIFGLLSKRLEEGYYRGENGFILDGIPRNHIQAEILDQIVDIDLVVNFKCTEECLVKKHLGTCICSRCQESLIGNLGSTNLKLNSRHAQLTAQNEDTRSEKLRIYAEQRKPLEDYYKKQKKLINFQVASGPRETWKGLLAALHLQHINATLSSPKLMS